MRAQLRLLEYPVHMWNMDEKSFHVGAHTLTIDIEDIYFLTGLSRWVTLTGSRGGSEPMNYYISQHCVPGTKKHSGKVTIRDSIIAFADYPLYYYSHGREGDSPYGSAEPFSVCIGVSGALSLQLV
jgi:hypothetical protein